MLCETGKSEDSKEDPGGFSPCPVGCLGFLGDEHVPGGVPSPPPPRFVPVTCDLGGNAAFEVQLRQKTQHWSSYWSDWSKSIFVPEGEKGPQYPRPPCHGHPGLATRLASFLLQKSWRAQS